MRCGATANCNTYVIAIALEAKEYLRMFHIQGKLPISQHEHHNLPFQVTILSGVIFHADSTYDLQNAEFNPRT